MSKKNIFRWEDYTTLWPNRFITEPHPCPWSWDLENSSLDWPQFLLLPTIWILPVCNAVTVVWVAKGFAALSLPKTTNQPERMACVHRTKEQGFHKRGSFSRPSVPPSALPSLLVTNKLISKSHRNQVKRHGHISSWPCPGAPQLWARMWQLSFETMCRRRDVFLNITLSLEINSDGGDEENP